MRTEEEYAKIEVGGDIFLGGRIVRVTGDRAEVLPGRNGGFAQQMGWVIFTRLVAGIVWYGATSTTMNVSGGERDVRNWRRLKVHRLGFGAMRITGDGIWGEPRELRSVSGFAAGCGAGSELYRYG